MTFIGDHGDRLVPGSLSSNHGYICMYTHTNTHPFPKDPVPQFQNCPPLPWPKALTPTEAASYVWPETPSWVQLKNELGSLGGLCLSACQEAGRKPAEFLSTPAPVHRAWWPMQVTAKLSLAKSQSHEAAGAGPEGCRWSGQPVVFSDLYSAPGQKPQTGEEAPDGLSVPWALSLLHPPQPPSTPIRAWSNECHAELSNRDMPPLTKPSLGRPGYTVTPYNRSGCYPCFTGG